MAAKKKASSSKKTGKPLVIVESPAKARTIKKFLGSDYNIEASVGHVRDLPANATEIPAAYKKEKWARLGINVEEEFKPLYVVPKAKKEQLKKLKGLLADASKLYLATDEDREGESISWHLVQELKPKVEVERLVFHEITKSAISESLDNPRRINEDLVEAQETRRLVDRLYGYTVSPLLWKKIRPRLSAGRVQSVAVRLVVERERERIRFVSADYWTIQGTFEVADQAPFDANLVQLDGSRIALGKDFDPDTGQLKDQGKGKPTTLLSEERAKAVVDALAGKNAKVVSLEQKPYTERPSPPFTTSTLQQEAGRKLRFTARRAMSAAQRLYENGYITYMRTDSTTLSAQAVAAARSHITSQFGADYVPDQPRNYATKVKNAQEAHEAIRPAGDAFTQPKDLGPDMGQDERRLYELIFKRTVACQMKDARGKRTTLVLEASGGDVDEARFQATGRTIDFPGYRLAYVEDTDDPEQALADSERILPDVAEGQQLGIQKLDPSGHTTQPPARLTEASLVRELEARGIGRPSTYASIIETILAREYCFKKGSALVPTFTAFAVINLLDRYLPNLVDYAFTAEMENDLDEISNGRQKRLNYLEEFYHGNGHPGLLGTLQVVEEKIDPREVCGIPLGKNDDGEVVEVRVGRYGPFLSCGDNRVSVPDDMPPDEMDLEKAIELLAKGAEGPKSLGVDEETGLQVFVKNGRFGPYFQLGDPESLDGEKPKMASLLKGMDPETVTFAEAKACLDLPRVVGTMATKGTDDAPSEELEILAANGRYGPYIKWGKETRSLPPDESPLTVSLEKAKELLAQPKARGRQRAAPKVLRELGEHPTSGEALRILDGRYGPYVTDGEINASLPRGSKPEELGIAQAVELLEARAAKKPRKKKAKKKATKKKATKKKAAKKKTGSKKKPADGE